MAAAICRSRRAGRTDGDTETKREKDRGERERKRDSVVWKIKEGGEEPDEPAKLIMESSFWPYLT